MAHTSRTTLDRPAAGRSLAVSSFDRVRPASPARRRTAGADSVRPIGTSPASNPQRDLQMFTPHNPRPAASAVAIEELSPLLPPVISEPLRTRRAQREPAAQTPPRRRVTSASARRRLRLTVRGYAALFGLAVALIAGTSAVSVASAEPSASVATTQVVARSGETVQQIAARTAGGRDVTEVAASIAAANGLDAGAIPQPGDVLIVPGS